jgi:ribosomal protein S27AE
MAQRRILEDWMRSKGITRCPACGEGGWRLAEAAYVRTLLEKGEEDLTGGVVKIPCGNCGYVALFDAEMLGIRGVWAQERNP